MRNIVYEIGYMYIKCKLSEEANSVVSKIGDVQIFYKPV